MKNVKKTLLEEIESILDKNDICSYMDTNISEVKYRLTPMIIGLFTDVNCKTVNTWLHRMGEEQLSPRNAFEAMFIYVYRKYSGDKVKERVKKWQHLFKTYNNTIENTLINRVPVTIETFGDLCAVLKNDSESPNEFRTFATKNYTEQVIYPKLEEFINSDEEDAFEQYLLFLTEDESINSYQRKATYYLRRFLYEIIMDGIYLLYNRHQYEFTKEENQKTRKAAFSSDESFNKFIKYNCICLKGIKASKPIGAGEDERTKELKEKRKNALKNTLRHILDYNTEEDSIGLGYEELKQWLNDKEFLYGSLATDFYELFGNINEKPIEYRALSKYIFEDDSIACEKIEYSDYDIIRKAFISEKTDMPSLKEGQSFIPYKDRTGTAEFLIKKYIDFKKKDNRGTYNKLFKDMISGKVNVSRRMILLLGIFAGYDYNDLNNILSKCGFDELKKSSSFDNAVLLILKFDYIQKQKNMYNNEKFLLKTTKIDEMIDQKDYEPFLSYVPEKIIIEDVVDGSAIKKDYEAILNELKEDYMEVIYELFAYIENDTSLPAISDIFLNDRMKNILERQNKELAKINTKIKKM